METNRVLCSYRVQCVGDIGECLVLPLSEWEVEDFETPT